MHYYIYIENNDGFLLLELVHLVGKLLCNGGKYHTLCVKNNFFQLHGKNLFSIIAYQTIGDKLITM